MLTKQFRPFASQIRSLDEKRRAITFVASTEAVDRYGDIIRVRGWKLDNYKKNPVFLWGHRSGDPPIGRTVRIWTESNPPALVQEVEFATKDVYPWADTIYKLYQAGFLKAVSVGFMPLEDPKPIVNEKTGEMTGYEFTKQELLELSAVSVPANPEALGRAVKKGILTEVEARDFSRRATSMNVPQNFLDALDREEKQFGAISSLEELMRALRA